MNFKNFNFLLWVVALVILTACKDEKVTPEKIEAKTAYYSQRVCPMRINDNMVMDSVVYHADKPGDYFYYYTVGGIMDNDYELPVLIDGQRSIYLTNLKTDDEMEPVRQLGVTVHHVFRSLSTGKVLYNLAFVSEEYNGDYITNAPTAPKKRRRSGKKKK